VRDKIAGDYGVSAIKITGDLDFSVKKFAYIKKKQYLCTVKSA